MMGKERNVTYSSFFDSDCCKNKYGLMLMHKIDVAVRVEDLNVTEGEGFVFPQLYYRSNLTCINADGRRVCLSAFFYFITKAK